MDRKPVLAVVVFLGVIALACIAGSITLVALDKSVPDGLWTIAATSVGAIAAVLTSARYTPAADAPAAVQVVNDASEPVPTQDTPSDRSQGSVSATSVEPDVQELTAVQSAAAALPPSAFGSQFPVAPGPIDSNAIRGYETGPADQPSSSALSARTMGTPPAQD